jgi:hypothetical protein
MYIFKHRWKLRSSIFTVSFEIFEPLPIPPNIFLLKNIPSTLQTLTYEFQLWSANRWFRWKPKKVWKFAEHCSLLTQDKKCIIKNNYEPEIFFTKLWLEFAVNCTLQKYNCNLLYDQLWTDMHSGKYFILSASVKVNLAKEVLAIFGPNWRSGTLNLAIKEDTWSPTQRWVVF